MHPTSFVVDPFYFFTFIPADYKIITKIYPQKKEASFDASLTIRISEGRGIPVEHLIPFLSFLNNIKFL